MSAVWHFGCNHDHSNLFAARVGMTEEERRRESQIIRKKFRNAILLSTAFLLVEVIGGYLSNSLAIWSDASHLLSDVISLFISLGASYLAERPKDPKRATFGWQRVESLAALLSMISLLCLTLYLMVMAISRLSLGNSEDVNGRIMSGVSLSGIFVNLGLVAILGEHHHVGLQTTSTDPSIPSETNRNNTSKRANPNDDLESPARTFKYTALNQVEDDQDKEQELVSRLRQRAEADSNEDIMINNSASADEGDDDDDANDKNKERKMSLLVMSNVNLHATYVHVLGDLLQSIGVFVAGLLILIWPGSALWIDPICTMLFCSLVIATTVPVVRTSLSVLLLQVPSNLDGVAIQKELEDISGIERVEQLRIFSVSQEKVALTAHLFITKTSYSEDIESSFESTSKSIVENVKEITQSHSITEVTVQVEVEPEREATPLIFGLNGGDTYRTCLVCPTKKGEQLFCSSLSRSLTDRDSRP